MRKEITLKGDFKNKEIKYFYLKGKKAQHAANSYKLKGYNWSEDTLVFFFLKKVQLCSIIRKLAYMFH